MFLKLLRCSVPSVVQLQPCFRSLWMKSLRLHSLAQQDSILETLHEVVPDPLAGHILDPQPQLFLLLGVVLPSQLRRGQRSEVRQG